MKIMPRLTLNMQKTTGDFLIQNCAIDPEIGFASGWGKEVPVTDTQMRISGIEIILDNLKDFGIRKFESPNDYLRFTDEEWKKRRKELIQLSVVQQTPSHLTITKMIPIRGKKGFIGSTSRNISTASSPENFYNLIIKIVND